LPCSFAGTQNKTPNATKLGSVLITGARGDRRDFITKKLLKPGSRSATMPAAFSLAHPSRFHHIALELIQLRAKLDDKVIRHFYSFMKNVDAAQHSPRHPCLRPPVAE
jgi:hypothetical protein